MNGSMHNRRRPSDILAARGMAPSTGSSLEHELAARHVLIYPKLEPLDADPLKNLVESTLFKARSWRVGQANSPVSVLTVNSAAPLPVDEKFIVHGQDQISVTSTMSILGPAPPPKYCDPRLSRLRIGFWTRVAISNDLAAALISFYLENDHPIMGMFDADLFLDDLVEHRLTYCSAMLVTAVLYLSCVSASLISSGLTLTYWHSKRTRDRTFVPHPSSPSFWTRLGLCGSPSRTLTSLEHSLQQSA